VMPKDYKAVLQKQKAAKVSKQPQPVMVSK
jgi:hypothetical protein